MPVRRKSASDPKGQVGELQQNENDEVLRVKVIETECACAVLIGYR